VRAPAGEKYLHHLIEQGSFDQAAQRHGRAARPALVHPELRALRCPKLLGDSPEQWEAWVYVFHKHEQLRVRLDRRDELTYRMRTLDPWRDRHCARTCP
jgi:hypothetical protein